ncbi:hypothetical protein BT69DRAFT_1304976 [Atractiella rhizophila]|nr:hypothetical protein BT69DRAFT_1304976 [Atractiella rhizophila]
MASDSYAQAARQDSLEPAKKKRRFDDDGSSSPLASSAYGGRYSSPPTSIPGDLTPDEKADSEMDCGSLPMSLPMMGTFSEDTSCVPSDADCLGVEEDSTKVPTIISPRKNKPSPAKGSVEVSENATTTFQGTEYPVINFSLRPSQKIQIGRPMAQKPQDGEMLIVPNKFAHVSRRHCTLRVAADGRYALLAVEGKAGVTVDDYVVKSGKKARISWEEEDRGFEMLLAKQVVINLTILPPVASDVLKTPTRVSKPPTSIVEDSPLSPVPSPQPPTPQKDYSAVISSHLSKSNIPLEGMLASAIVFNPKGCVPESEVIREVLSNNRDLLTLVSPEEDMDMAVEIWREPCLAILRKRWENGGFFGRVGNQGLKDAEGREIESTYYYCPEKDPDEARAKELVDFVRPVRENRKAGGKQYFWKKVGGKRKR